MPFGSSSSGREPSTIRRMLWLSIETGRSSGFLGCGKCSPPGLRHLIFLRGLGKHEKLERSSALRARRGHLNSRRVHPDESSFTMVNRVTISVPYRCSDSPLSISQHLLNEGVTGPFAGFCLRIAQTLVEWVVL